MPPRRSSSASPSPDLRPPCGRLARLLRRPIRPGADGWARPGRRTIYILPTREGLLLAPTLLATGLVGLHYNNNAALAAAFLLVAVALVTALHTWRALAGLGVRAVAAGEAFAGGSLRFRVGLDGGGQARHLRLKAGEASVETAVPADGTAEALLALPAPRRGRLGLDPLRVETTQPLGLFRAWAWVETGAAAWIYPAPAPPTPLPPGAGGESATGAAAAGIPSPEGEVADLSPWRAGESLRRIHWPLAARGRGLLARRFAAPAGSRLVLDWDQAAGPPEARLSRLCRWVLEAERRGLDYGLRLPGRTVPPGSGPGHRRRCLEALARWPG